MTIAIAYSLTAYIGMEQIFIMPEVKVNAKKCFAVPFPPDAPAAKPAVLLP